MFRPRRDQSQSRERLDRLPFVGTAANDYLVYCEDNCSQSVGGEDAKRDLDNGSFTRVRNALEEMMNLPLVPVMYLGFVRFDEILNISE